MKIPSEKLLLLRSHYVQYIMVGFVHAGSTYEGKIADAVVNIVVDNSLYARNAVVFHSQHRRKCSGRNSSGNLQRTARLGTVANHTGNVGNHILYRIANLLVGSTHQIGNATARTSRCYHAAAQSRQTTKALLDID